VKQSVSSEAIGGAEITRGRGRPRLPEGDLALRRAKIVETASRMFFVNGFEQTTLEAIGRRSGVTKRTIYELIGDKSALFRAACDELRAHGPRFSFDVPVSGRSARDVLYHMARQLIDQSLDPELVLLVRAVMIESTRFPELVSEVIARGKTGLDGAIARVFDDLVAHGLIPPIPAGTAGTAASVFYNVAVGAGGFRAALGRPDEPLSDSELLERVDMFLHGYLLRAAES
jgi:TetR/AcrR family transcriptional repressor of mexJK operon